VFCARAVGIVQFVVLVLVNATSALPAMLAMEDRASEALTRCGPSVVQLAEIARQFAAEDGNDESKTSVLSPEAAVLIFTSRATKSSKLRDSSSAKLAKEHGVTTKAVRDIWNMR